MSGTTAHAAGPIGVALRFIGACREAAVRRLAAVDNYDLAAALLFVTLIIVIGLTFEDYGISNDEAVQQRYGELIIADYASGFADQAVFHFKNLYLYGGLFDLAAIGLEKLVPLDPYAVRHLLSALTGLGGIAAAWAAARAIGGSRAGLLASLALALCGTWYGAMFNHTKDIPFAAAMMGALYYLLRIGRELPRPRWRLVALFGVMCGCALGIRVLGLFLVGYAALALLLHAPISRGGTWRGVPAFAARSATPLAAAFVIAYLIMIAAWPWAALAPLNPLRALTTFVDFNYPISTILSGHVYEMADVPRWYVPNYIAIKLTLWLLVGAALALVLAALPQRGERASHDTWRKETALVAFAALFPLICHVAVNGPAFTGMRHFLFIVPPIAVLAGLGVSGLFARLEAVNRPLAALGLVLALADLGFNATTLYRLHPDEYLFYNPLVGGLAGASRKYVTDYWVNMMPEAVGDLEHYLDRTEGKGGKTLSRHYWVAVCSERVQFEKEADARLQWTRDINHAQFFIAPTHMDCDESFGGKVIATVKRMGVVIGVVKDRRTMVGGSVAGLN